MGLYAFLNLFVFIGQGIDKQEIFPGKGDAGLHIQLLEYFSKKRGVSSGSGPANCCGRFCRIYSLMAATQKTASCLARTGFPAIWQSWARHDAVMIPGPYPVARGRAASCR